MVRTGTDPPTSGEARTGLGRLRGDASQPLRVEPSRRGLRYSPSCSVFTSLGAKLVVNIDSGVPSLSLSDAA